jgi:hypothetical protein
MPTFPGDRCHVQVIRRAWRADAYRAPRPPRPGHAAGTSRRAALGHLAATCSTAIGRRRPAPHAFGLAHTPSTAGLDHGTLPAECQGRTVVSRAPALGVREHGGGHPAAGGPGAPGGLTGGSHLDQPRRHGDATGAVGSGLDRRTSGELAGMVTFAEPIVSRRCRAPGPPAHGHPRRLRRPAGPAETGRRPDLRAVESERHGPECALPVLAGGGPPVPPEGQERSRCRARRRWKGRGGTRGRTRRSRA